MQMNGLLDQKDLGTVLEAKPATMTKKEGGFVTEHVVRHFFIRLPSVRMKLDDETKAVLLLSYLPVSWSGTVTMITNSMETEAMAFEKMRDLVLGDDVRRRNVSRSSSSDLLHAGRVNNRSSGSGKGHRRSSSRARSDVRCWDRIEKKHTRTVCLTKASKGEELCTVDASVEDDDVLVSSEVVCAVNSWVMDSDASFHATRSNECMRNVKIGDFGRVRLGTGGMLDVIRLGDVDLTTTLDTWTLKNVWTVSRLRMNLISVSESESLDMSVSIGNGKWCAVRGNLVIAKGIKLGSLYLLPVPSGDLITPKTSDKIRLADSMNKRVKIIANDSKVLKNQFEHIQKSERVREFRNSGSTKGVLTQSRMVRWVRKTDLKIKFSPVELFMESVPLWVPEAECRRLRESVGIEDVDTVLRPAEASTSPGT